MDGMVIPRSKIQGPRKHRGEAGPFGVINKLLDGAGGGASFMDMTLVTILSVVTTYLVLRYTGSMPAGTFFSTSPNRPYNDTSLAKIRNGADGWKELDLVVVTDLDHDSKHTSKKNTWISVAKRGVLRLSGDRKKASVNWDDSKDFILSTQISAGGRAMELSDLSVFDGRLLSSDDRTGLVFEIKNNQAIPWLLLNDGPGNVTKGLKAEWMTVKNKELYVGGLGKEWTTTTGEYVNDHPMWVKVVSPSGEIRHENWRDIYINVRKAIGIEYPGYMIHEAVQWSEVNGKWFFLPRRASKEKYDETADEHRGTNVMIIANADLTSFTSVEIGKKGDGAKGFSAFQFIPDTNDELIVALKSEEKDGKPVASYISVFDTKGHVIMEDSPLHGAHKFEGIAFA